MKLIAFVVGIVLAMFLFSQRNARKREEARVAREAFVADSVRKAFVADSTRRAYVRDSTLNARAALYNDLRAGRRTPTFGTPNTIEESDFRGNEAAEVAAEARRREACLAREARMESRPVLSRCDQPDASPR